MSDRAWWPFSVVLILWNTQSQQLGQKMEEWAQGQHTFLRASNVELNIVYIHISMLKPSDIAPN